MHCNILLPADLPLPGQRMIGAAEALSHLERKSFSAFFLQDYFPKREKGKDDYLTKVDVQVTLQQEARILAVDFEFLEYYRNHLSLNYQSSFADLLVISGKQISSNVFSDKFFELINCPMLLYFDSFKIPDEIVFLFDHDKRSLAALKSYIALFGELSKEKKVTVITISPENEDGIYYEKCLVSYTQKVFTDVGIIPMGPQNLNKGLIKLLSKINRPLLIAGKPAISILENQMDQLTKHAISIYHVSN